MENGLLIEYMEGVPYCTLRIKPESVKMGRTAGAAAYLAHTGNVSPRKIDVAQLQDTLRQADVIIERRSPAK